MARPMISISLYQFVVVDGWNHSYHVPHKAGISDLPIRLLYSGQWNPADRVDSKR